MLRRYAQWSYLAAATAARTGDEMSGPALLLAGLAVTGSAASASYLLAAIMVSAAVGGPVLGTLIDRSSRPGRLLAGALALYAGALGVILAGLGRLPLACTTFIAAFAGLVSPAISGGWTSQLPHAVPAEALPRANALDAMTFNLAGLAGPALASVVATTCGASAAVAAAIVLICLALPSAWLLPPAGVPAKAAPGTTVTADLTGGLRAVTHVRPLARATLTSAISCMGAGALLTCTPLLGDRVLGSASHGMMLPACTAVSALMTNALLSRHPLLLRPDTIIGCSTVVLAAAPLVAATDSPMLLIAAMVAVGVGEGPQLTALFAVRHREAPEHLRGQIFTTGAGLKITGFAIGVALAGPVATWSLPGALLFTAGLQALACLAFGLISAWPERWNPISDGVSETTCTVTTATCPVAAAVDCPEICFTSRGEHR